MSINPLEQLDLLTVKETATRLKMSISLVYRLVEQGQLACYRVGNGRGRIRISEQDLNDYLAQCKQGIQVITKKPSLRPKLKHLKL